MAGSVLADVTDALVARFTAALDVPVFDGPLVQSPTDLRFVLVGATELPGEGGDGEDLQATLSRSPMGNGEFADESGFVTCAAWAATGDTGGVSVTRRAALDLAASCAATVNADPSLGGVLKFGFYAEVSSLRVQQGQTGAGYTARAVFTVTYTTLLTP